MPAVYTNSKMRERCAWWVKRGAGLIFDLLHGVDTSIPAEGLQIASTNAQKGVAYDLCPWSTLRRSLGLVSLQPNGFTFVDVGSGKGKVLLSAQVLPFAHIVGVEYSSYLNRVAEQNIASARFLVRRCRSVKTICIDAVKYPIPEVPIIFFFANPFGYEVMEIVINNIIDSYLRVPREVFLIFYAASTIMPNVSRQLYDSSSERVRWLASTTFRRKSINIFELPASERDVETRAAA